MHKFLPTKEIVEYPNGGKSYFYVMDQTVIIVDEEICKYDSKEDVFSYTLITDKQNYFSGLLCAYGRWWHCGRRERRIVSSSAET